MMRSIVALAVCSVLGVFAFVCRAEACWQSGVPSVYVRLRSLAGTVTLNDKPFAESSQKPRLAFDPMRQVGTRRSSLPSQDDRCEGRQF